MLRVGSFRISPIAAAAALVIVVLLAISLWPTTVPVDVAAIERGTLRQFVDEEGQARVRDRVILAAPAPGRLVQAPLQPGDRVTRGRTVVAIIATELGAADERAIETSLGALLSAERAVDRARSEAAEATVAALVQGTLNGVLAFFGRPATPATSTGDQRQAAASTIARAETEAARLRARAEAAGRIASPRGARIVIRAPASGVVLKRYRDSVGSVGLGEPLLEIGDPSALEILVPILSRDAVRVQPGAQVTIQQWGGAALNGTVARVAPSATTVLSALGVPEQRVQVVATLGDTAAAVAAGLRDGFRVEVRILVWEQADAIKVPTTALVRRGSGWAVFRVENNRAREQTIGIGQIAGSEAQVLNGLQPGDRVVVHPPETLESGARVKPAS